MSEFAGQIMGGLSTVAAAGWTSVLAQLLGTAEGATGGGLPVLIAQFEIAGLGEKIHSWIHGADKQPVTADEIAQVLPPSQLTDMAERSGLDRAELTLGLAEILPHAVDHVTPDGALPPNGTNADLAALFERSPKR